MMNGTSLTLLNRLRQSTDTDAWNRLLELYAPLLAVWLRRFGVQASDADDLVQEVMLAAWTDLKSFEHSGRPGAFRSWLRTILVHRLFRSSRTSLCDESATNGDDSVRRSCDVRQDGQPPTRRAVA